MRTQIVYWDDYKKAYFSMFEVLMIDQFLYFVDNVFKKFVLICFVKILQS